MNLADAYLEFTLAKDRSPASTHWYQSRLGSYFAWLKEQGVVDVEGITLPLTRRYVEARRRASAWSSHTLHGHVRAIRAFLFWAAREELLDDKLPRRLTLPVREQYVIATLSPNQVERLLAATKASPQPLRDAAIISVLLDTGVRIAELCGLTLDRTFLSADDSYLVVKGKGRRDREVSLGARSRAALAKYLHRERPKTAQTAKTARGEPPYTFLGRTGTQVRPEGLDRMLYRTRDRAGAEHFRGVRVSAHTFRHTYAVNYLASGGDVYKLSRTLGHSNVTTTEGYLKSFSARDARKGISVLDALESRGK